MRGKGFIEKCKTVRLAAMLLAALMLCTASAEAANHYVRDGATGNCSDWTNACDELSTAEANAVRGDTIYLADGVYSGVVFDRAPSGTSLITIKKATISDHGTDTGWQGSYGDGQAAISAPIRFQAGYYVLDGQTGGGPGSWDSGYGIKVYVPGNSEADLIIFGGAAVSNITIQHIDISYDYNAADANPYGHPGCESIAGSQDAVTNFWGGAAPYSWSATDITIRHCRFNRPGRTALLTRNAISNWVLEYNYFRDSSWGCPWTGSDWQHAEIWSADHDAGGLANIVFRYNMVGRFRSTGGLMLAGGNNIYVYGNIFNGTAEAGANGAIGNWTAEAISTNVHIFNNTFVDTDATLAVGNTGVWHVYNNLFCNNQRLNISGTTHDYNANCAALSEAHSQVLSSSVFSDYHAGTSGTDQTDYYLTEATDAGLDLTAQPWWNNAYCSNTDMTGKIRGADGVWDRGAYEYVSGHVTPPAAPTGLSVK